MFDDVAEFYALLSDTEVRARRETPFLAKCLEEAPGKRVADVACGTGFHASLFSGMGAEVRAFDLSERMVIYARGKYPDLAHAFHQCDMCNIHGGPYDMIVCLGNSLSLLPDRAAVSKFFASARENLANGGLLVVHVLNYALPANALPRHRVERAERSGREIVAVKDLVPVSMEYTLLNLCFGVRDVSGAWRTLTDTAMIRHVNEPEIRGEGSAAGLQLVRVCGGYDGQDYRVAESPDLIVVLQG